MINLFTLHIGVNKPKYYGVELLTIVNSKNGYGLFVFIYDVDKQMGIWDIFFLSAVWDLLKKFGRWF